VNSKRKSMVAVAAVAAMAVTPIAAQARQGADDPAGHNQGDDASLVRHGADDHRGTDVTKARHHKRHSRAHHARHGADDRPGDNRGGHGADDPAGHR